MALAGLQEGAYTQLASDIVTGPQPTAETVQALSKHGIKAVINLRPDTENGWVDHSQACKDLGLTYLHAPTGRTQFSTDGIEELVESLDDCPKPALVYCQSGNRAIGLCLCSALTRSQLSDDEVAGLLQRTKGYVKDFTTAHLQKLAQEQVPPVVHCIRHVPSSTCTYVVSCPVTKACALIDTCVDFEQASGSMKYMHANSVIAYVEQQGFKVEYILETHVHADHISASQYIQKRVGGKVCIGQNISTVQKCFDPIYNTGTANEQHFDVLFKDGTSFSVGELVVNVIHTPGHTPACISYLIGDAVFTGDTLFHPTIGTARCDFPGGSCEDMWNSCQKLLALPPTTRNFLGHDYPGTAREFTCEVSIGEQLENNKMVKRGSTKEGYTAARSARDATLNVPGLLIPSIQLNIRGGKMPPAENNGMAYLKIPINAFGKAEPQAT